MWVPHRCWGRADSKMNTCTSYNRQQLTVSFDGLLEGLEGQLPPQSNGMSQHRKFHHCAAVVLRKEETGLVWGRGPCVPVHSATKPHQKRCYTDTLINIIIIISSSSSSRGSLFSMTKGGSCCPSWQWTLQQSPPLPPLPQKVLYWYTVIIITITIIIISSSSSSRGTLSSIKNRWAWSKAKVLLSQYTLQQNDT